MMNDEFTLYDEDGNEVMSRRMVEHINLAINEQGLLKGEKRERHYTVVSDVSGYKMEVNKDTKQEDWREYAEKCAWALD